MAVRRTNQMCYLMNRRQGAMFVFCVIAWGWLVTVAASPNEAGSCNYVQSHISKILGVKPYSIREATDGEVCTSQRSCCPRLVEERLAISSRRQLEKNVTEAIGKIANSLDTKAKSFDNLFKEMLSNSKREFHDMFKRTYGIIYIQNSYVFSDLFSELENYYSKGQGDLAETIHDFFTLLYQRMFSVINSQYSFDEKYLVCVGDHMNELRPFGDVPHKFSTQLKRSFVATRTYGKALAVGAEVVRKMMTIKLTPECANALLRMQHCGACNGYLEPRACSDYCSHVMKSCLSAHVALNNDWNAYVMAIEKVGDRLVSSFNIEHVVSPINIKISEAIMNFQDNGQEVSQKVFSACGKPILDRRRRSATAEASQQLQPQQQPSPNSDLDIDFEDSKGPKELARIEPVKFKKKNSNNNGNKKDRKEPVSMSTLEKIIKEAKLRVKDSFDLWQHLPYQMCNGEGMAEAPSETRCWNGSAIAAYSKPPDTPPHYRALTVLNEQTYVLKSIISKLRDAYQGKDVDWVDHEETGFVSGSGSGDDDSERSDDEDDDNIQGSGDTRDHTYAYPVPELPVTPPLPPAINNNNNNGTYGRETPSHTSSASRKELPLALTRYLLPIVAIWLGAMFSELL